MAWPVAVFFVSVLWGFAVAYDKDSAASKLAFVCGGLLSYVLLATTRPRVRWQRRDVPVLRAIVAAVPAALALWFLLANDWSAPVEKAAWLDPIRRALAVATPNVAVASPHPNMVGAVLAMWLPLQCAALVSRRRAAGRGAILGPAAVAVLAFSAFALLMTGLRGAWLSLAVAAAIGAAIFGAGRTHATRGRAASGRAGLTALAVVCAALAAAGVAWWFGLRPDRWFVWRTSLDLALDYPFTGLGLGGFTMAYSSYVLQVHVPHTTHAHNLLLDLWLEQGPLGAAAFLTLATLAIASATRGGAPAVPDAARWPRWRVASVVSLLVVLLHGLIDDGFYGYGGGGAIALFVPVALLSRAGQHTRLRLPRRRHRTVILGAAILVLLLLTLPATRSAWMANLGALWQSRVELSAYEWPRWPVQDAVRRAFAPRLAPAVARYESALRIDPSNVTANRRLGQMALSLGRYDAARQHLEAALPGDPGGHATRQLLGEALAVTGDPARAAEVWRPLQLDPDRLAVRQFWYDAADPGQRAEWMREAVALAVAQRQP